MKSKLSINDDLIDFLRKLLFESSGLSIDIEDISKTYLNDEERVIVKSFPFREVKISGAVKNPGTYRLNQGDGILELINRSGGPSR